MRVLVVSDLHFEFRSHDRGASVFNSLVDADVVVIAGDLDTFEGLEWSILRFCRRYPAVVFVAGNHEYYHANTESVHALLRKLDDTVDNFYWLDNSVVDVDGVLFAGTTLWFGDDYIGSGLAYFLNDFRCIYGDFENWVRDSNEQAIEFLKNVVNDVDVVVTHHVPHPSSIDPKFRGDQMNIFYLCDVSDIMVKRCRPGLWIHGHTHHSVDEVVGGWRVVANPLGYPHEVNEGFQADFLLEVGEP